MKLLNKIKYYDFYDFIEYFEYIYENNITKEEYNTNEVFWFKNNKIHKKDGAARQNCQLCIKEMHSLRKRKSIYNRHFYLDGFVLYPNEFAEKNKSHNM